LKFSLTPKNQAGDKGPMVEEISNSAVTPFPACPFLKRHQYTKTKLTGSTFRVVSYNILADLYATTDLSKKVLFKHCPQQHISIHYRKHLLFKELLGYNSDLICLQEVDIKVFNKDFEIILSGDIGGYGGILSEKGETAEGLATYYRKDRFDHLESFSINISTGMQTLPFFAQIWQKISSNQALFDRTHDRSTTLQLNLFKLKDQDYFILVANTHLYFHPNADHIRLLQAGFSIMYLEEKYKEVLEKYQIKNENHLALVFCGDFNSCPENGIYKLMTKGSVDERNPEWKSSKLFLYI